MSDEADPVMAALMRLEAGQERFEAGLTALRADLMGRLDRLQHTFAGIRDDIALNYGTADQVRRANDHTREELHSLSRLVMAMSTQIQLLQTQVRELRGEP